MEYLSVRPEHAIDDPYAVAVAPVRAGFVEYAAGATFQANGNFIALGRFCPFLDFIARECTADSTSHSGEILAAATAYLMAEYTADHGAADTADAAARTGFTDFAYRFDHAAVGTN